MRVSQQPLARSWVELRTKRESLLRVLDEDANLGGHTAAARPHVKDWHHPFKGRQKTNNRTFSEFRSEPRMEYFPLVLLLKEQTESSLKLVEVFSRILVPTLDKTERLRHLAL